MKKVLSSLKKGQSGIVQKIYVNEIKRKMHLLELGLTMGTRIKVKKIALSGELISIQVRGYELCISKKDAERIIVNV